MKKSPCDICVENLCKGKNNCNCEICNKKDLCARYQGLKPTIRITRKCTQSCSHCCFSCGPKEVDMMSLEMAKDIHKFLVSNNIRRAEIMGGEFFMNPDWEEILGILGEGLNLVRLVTAGDWAGNEALSKKVIKFLVDHDNFYVGLSKDKWHTNAFVEDAANMLKDNGVIYRLALDDEITDSSIVPIGRSEFDYGLYSMFSTYCTKPDRMYSFLIDEKGEIYKCGFGVWDYANIKDYTEGGFSARFKEFGTKFYKIFISNCRACKRSYDLALREEMK